MRNEFKQFDTFGLIFKLATGFILLVWLAVVSFIIYNFTHPMSVKANLTPDGNGGYNFEVRPSR